MLVGTMYFVGVMEKVIRPCLAALVPKEKGGVTVLVDVGVNPDAKPELLEQFGLLGSIYAKCALGIDAPKVALANIGEEEEKGNAQTLAAHKLMKATMKGTGLSECAVFGEPSAFTALSALPWSAVMSTV